LVSTRPFTSGGIYTYTYDNEGNKHTRTVIASGATTTYDWNVDRQLLAVHRPDGTTSTYRYDPLGRHVEVNNNSQVTRYV
jgi:YD repeat-containing protein